MTTETLIIHEAVLKRFNALFEEGRLAHAYLFVGPHNIGKSETAFAVAKIVNCDKKIKDASFFCDSCPSCIKINSGNHPDVHLVSRFEDKTEIMIEQIRALSGQSHLKSFEGKSKIFIVKNAEDLNAEAGNALLKTLEEPAPDSLILLTTSSLERIFDTVISRCHIIRFFPIGEKLLEENLARDARLDKRTAHFLAYFTEGALGQAVNLQGQKTFERKNGVIDNFVLAKDSEPYFKELLMDKEKTREALKILYTWFRDVMLIKMGAGDLQLIHTDRLKDLKNCERLYSFEEIDETLKDIADTTRLLEENLNLKIALTLLKEKIWRK